MTFMAAVSESTLASFLSPWQVMQNHFYLTLKVYIAVAFIL